MENTFLPLSCFIDFVDFCWEHVWYKSKFEFINVRIIYEKLLNYEILNEANLYQNITSLDDH